MTNPMSRDLFRQRFRREVREGTYVMHFANSGEIALEQLTDGIEPTLIVILSDINMPGMDGLQLLEAITQSPPMAMTSDDAAPATLAPSSSSPNRSISIS